MNVDQLRIDPREGSVRSPLLGRCRPLVRRRARQRMPEGDATVRHGHETDVLGGLEIEEAEAAQSERRADRQRGPGVLGGRDHERSARLRR